MKKPLVSIIIVNWNGESIIKDCIDSVINQYYKFIQIIVVDNKSADASISLIKEYKQVDLIEHKRNDGFAKGNNIGLNRVKGKYVLLLNSDASLLPDSLDTMVEFLEKNPSYSIVQPKILYKGNSYFKKIVINSIGAFYTKTGYLYYPGYGKNPSRLNYNTDMDIFSAFGACMLIKKDIIDRVGLFDSDYFAYFEETDFCMRVLLTGQKIRYLSSATAYHKGGVSSVKYGSSKIFFHSFKNRIRSYLKNLELSTLLILLPLHLLITEGSSFMLLVRRGPKFFIAIQKALLWNIRYLPQTLKKRRYIQRKIRRISDKQLFSTVEKNPRIAYYFYLLTGLEKYND